MECLGKLFKTWRQEGPQEVHDMMARMMEHRETMMADLPKELEDITTESKAKGKVKVPVLSPAVLVSFMKKRNHLQWMLRMADVIWKVTAQESLLGDNFTVQDTLTGLRRRTNGCARRRRRSTRLYRGMTLLMA